MIAAGTVMVTVATSEVLEHESVAVTVTVVVSVMVAPASGFCVMVKSVEIVVQLSEVLF